MEKQRDSKIMALVALVVAVIGTTVAFASLSSTLTIGGTSNVTVDSRWKVEFTDVHTTPSGSAVATTQAAINALDATKIDDYTVAFNAPGDSVVVDFTVNNKGTIDAKLVEIAKAAQPTCTSISDPVSETDGGLVCNKLTYTLTTYDGGEVNENTVLAARETQRMKLTLTYFADTTSVTTNDLPQGTVRVTDLGLSLKYDQNM